MSNVLLRQVRKSYGKTEVVHGVDCDISDGEFIVTLGPSGCGKSTVLRMIAGLERITSGEIRIGDRVVNNLEPSERDIAMVFQNYALYPHMSVFDNMAYSLKIRGTAKSEIRERVEKTAAILELGDLLARKPRELSGGQRQRVAMGRAIIRKPSVFLFDEPLSNLDAKLRSQMRIELRKLHELLRITSIYVTHDQIEAMTLADRLIVMNEGLFEQIGTPIDIYDKPATIFVAGFIGSPSMNFISARATEDQRLVLTEDVSIQHDKENLPVHGEKSVILGIRPEHLTISTEEASRFSFSVDFVEALGADTVVHGSMVKDGPSLILRVPGVVKIRRGEILPLTFDLRHLHVFDSETRKRLLDAS
ncbi:MAG TPA: sn-glycerol-3-phosphate import ATP-binding protein UgpC [Desulfobacteraceae bacterium]|nr:sn-glycerol-3-phosphate import ATP-binding protein UgpC [Desulfobacteraceae bacterium]